MDTPTPVTDEIMALVKRYAWEYRTGAPLELEAALRSRLTALETELNEAKADQGILNRQRASAANDVNEWFAMMKEQSASPSPAVESATPADGG